MLNKHKSIIFFAFSVFCERMSTCKRMPILLLPIMPLFVVESCPAKSESHNLQKKVPSLEAFLLEDLIITVGSPKNSSFFQHRGVLKKN